jgi:antitoxin HicB
VRPFTYAVRLAPDKQDGGYVVTCRDLPEAITQGETLEDALVEAADALEEAVAGRISDGRDIPMPSDAKRGERMVSMPPSMALKAAVYLAVREAGISNSELARRMRLDEKEARRILDPHHPTKLPRIEEALSVLGRHVELSLA